MPSEPSARPPLGRLEKIDLSTYWQGEETDFTPWLAQADNLKLLGDALGMELEVVIEEQQVGAFQVDLLCRDQATDRWVLIENQLETTDFSHLGRLITYAAGLDVCNVVWIASHFSAEHRAALDWLNQITQEEISFFGLEIELWRIGNVAMAANFNPVAQPQSWVQTVPEVEVVPEVEEEPLTETQQQNLDFWSGLCQQIERRGSIVKPGTPEPIDAIRFAIGRACFRLITSINREDGCLYTELHLAGEDAHPHFYLLAEEQETIEMEMGLPLIWDDHADDKACAIYCALPNVDLNDLERWPEYYHWLCDHLERFHEVFAERVKHLNATDYQPLPDYSFNPARGSLILPS
ncbi:MAG: DUF4268 domain-containing protein [Cyanobacteria bacterium Co-bin8]|nr:DUF4268 domain-containing protein [Cyanobacteria bacterium Co-bin8]